MDRGTRNAKLIRESQKSHDRVQDRPASLGPFKAAGSSRNSDARNRSQLAVFVGGEGSRHEERRDAQLPNTGHSASSITARLRRRGVVVDDDNRRAPRENP